MSLSVVDLYDARRMVTLHKRQPKDKILETDIALSKTYKNYDAPQTEIEKKYVIKDLYGFGSRLPLGTKFGFQPTMFASDPTLLLVDIINEPHTTTTTLPNPIIVTDTKVAMQLKAETKRMQVTDLNWDVKSTDAKYSDFKGVSKSDGSAKPATSAVVTPNKSIVYKEKADDLNSESNAFFFGKVISAINDASQEGKTASTVADILTPLYAKVTVTNDDDKKILSKIANEIVTRQPTISPAAIPLVVDLIIDTFIIKS